jgi:hypothetical protein
VTLSETSTSPSVTPNRLVLAGLSRWNTWHLASTFTRRVTPAQTLFGKRRAYQGKVAFADFDAICSGDILTFEADEAQMLSRFLPFLVQSNRFFDHALGTSAGSLSPRTNWRDLSRYEFDLPPLAEQMRIADLLWSVEAQRLSVKQTRTCAHALLGHLARQRLHDMPTTIRLRELTTTRSGPSFAAHDMHEHKVQGSVPIIGIPNTKPNGTIDLGSVRFLV